MTQLDEKLGRCCCRCRHRAPRPRSTALSALPAGACPTGFRYALEVRHRSWLAPETLPKLLELLQRTAVPSAWCSTPGCPLSTRSPRLRRTSAGWAAARTSPTTTSAHVRINRDASWTAGPSRSAATSQGVYRLRLLQQPLPGPLAGLGARAADAADRGRVSLVSASPHARRTSLRGAVT